MAKTIHELTAEFEIRRRGVTDPQRQTAIELQNITDLLLQLLEAQRRAQRQSDLP